MGGGPRELLSGLARPLSFYQRGLSGRQRICVAGSRKLATILSKSADHANTGWESVPSKTFLWRIDPIDGDHAWLRRAAAEIAVLKTERAGMWSIA